jgi:chromosome segregation ATPase
VDNLNEEFSEITVQLLEQNNSVEELETEVVAKTDGLKALAGGSDEYMHQEELLRQTAITLTTKKNLLESLELRKRSCVQRLELFKTQLEEKRRQLAQYEQEQRQKSKAKSMTKKDSVSKKSTQGRQ